MTGGPSTSDRAHVQLDDSPGRRSGLAEVEVDGETVVYDEETQKLHHLDPVASVVWALLDGHTPLTKTCDELAQAFGTPVETIRPDVLSVVGFFAAEGLLDR